MDRVEINGVDYTNKWSNSMPAAIGGKWYIYYKGSYAWSHFEAPAAKSVEESIASAIEIFPNPFADVVNIKLNGQKIRKIEVYSSMGQLLEVVAGDLLQSDLIRLSLNYPGHIFIMKIHSDQGVQNQMLFKK
jgi:hypothetical protein